MEAESNRSENSPYYAEMAVSNQQSAKTQAFHRFFLLTPKANEVSVLIAESERSERADDYCSGE